MNCLPIRSGIEEDMNPEDERVDWRGIGERNCFVDMGCPDPDALLTHARPNRYDDLIPEENDTVQLALRRLPPKEAYDRVYRLRRAFQVRISIH